MNAFAIDCEEGTISGSWVHWVRWVRNLTDADSHRVRSRWDARALQLAEGELIVHWLKEG